MRGGLLRWLVVVERPVGRYGGGGERDLGMASGGCARAREGEAAFLGLHSGGCAAERRVGEVVVVIVVEEGVEVLVRGRGIVGGLVPSGGVGLGDEADEVVAHRVQR